MLAKVNVARCETELLYDRGKFQASYHDLTDSLAARVIGATVFETKAGYTTLGLSPRSRLVPGAPTPSTVRAGSHGRVVSHWRVAASLGRRAPWQSHSCIGTSRTPAGRKPRGGATHRVEHPFRSLEHRWKHSD